MSMVMSTSRGTVSEVCIKFVKRRKKTRRWLQIQTITQKIHMNISINVYGYGRGGKM